MAMVIAIAFVYSQIKVVICESIMQHAVDNMALEMSSYVYIIDKLGLISHSELSTPTADEMLENGQKAVEDGKEIAGNAQSLFGRLDSFSDFLGVLETGGDVKAAANNLAESAEDAKGEIEQIAADATDMVSSIKAVVQAFKSGGLKDELKEEGKYGLEVLASTGLNAILSSYYRGRLVNYVPNKDLEKFCKLYCVNESTISFKGSRLFPGANNNTILVVVEYETTSPFSMFPIHRRIVKQAFTSAWLVDPDNAE